MLSDMLSDADQLQPHLPQFFQGQQVGRQHGFHSTTFQDLPGVQLNPQDRPKAKDFRWLARVLFPHQIHWKVIFDSMISFALSVCIQIYDRLSRLDNKIAHHSKPLSISKIKHGHRTSMENPQKIEVSMELKMNKSPFQIPYHFKSHIISPKLLPPPRFAPGWAWAPGASSAPRPARPRRARRPRRPLPAARRPQTSRGRSRRVAPGAVRGGPTPEPGHPRDGVKNLWKRMGKLMKAIL